MFVDGYSGFQRPAGQAALVDASTWIALIALAVASLGQVRSFGSREGKLDAAIEQLTTITADHEERLRKGSL